MEVAYHVGKVVADLVVEVGSSRDECSLLVVAAPGYCCTWIVDSIHPSNFRGPIAILLCSVYQIDPMHNTFK